MSKYSTGIPNLHSLQTHIENELSALPISLDKMLEFLKVVGECVETVPEGMIPPVLSTVYSKSARNY